MVPKNWFSGVLAATILVAASAHLSHAQQTGSQATIPSIDVAAEVASSVYYMSTVVEAVRAEADTEIRAKDRRIRELESKGQLAAAENAEIKRLQREIVDELESRDAELARQVAAFRAAVKDIASTPEGAAILATRRPGNLRQAREALLALEQQIAEADQRAVNIRRAERMRSIATIALDDRNKGEASTQEVIELYEQVVALDGISADWIQLARLYASNGDIAKWETSTRLAEEAAEAARDRAAALIERGYFEMSKGWYKDAIDTTRESVHILEELQMQNPANGLYARDLFVGKIAQGDASFAFGYPLAGVSDYFDGLRIVEQLAQDDPTNEELQTDIVTALLKIGDAYREGEMFSDAQPMFERAQGTVERLAISDPNDLTTQRYLAIALNKVGEIYHLQGQRELAKEALERSLSVARSLSAKDPSNSEWQHGVVISTMKLGDATGEISYYVDALEMVQQMERSGVLRPEDQWMLRDLKQRAELD